jgi:hypothetical protein
MQKAPREYDVLTRLKVALSLDDMSMAEFAKSISTTPGQVINVAKGRTVSNRVMEAVLKHIHKTFRKHKVRIGDLEKAA